MTTPRDDPKMSFVASCRLNGTTLFFIERFATNFDEAEVALDHGRIQVFTSEQAARAAIAHRFPLPRGTPLSEDASMAEVAAALEDRFAPHMKLSYDLDAAREWAKAPGPKGISPEDALNVWELCWQIGEAPRPQRFDPMGMYAMYENIMRDPDQRDHYELVLLGMKLSGLVIMAQERQRPATWELQVPELAELWPPIDFTRLAAILEKGVRGFAGRVLPS